MPKRLFFFGLKRIFVRCLRRRSCRVRKIGAEDRRIQKTISLLREALVCLIAEKPYDSIVVKEILDRANVGRSTATLVIDVVRRAGRVVARVNREHEFGLFAESMLRLLYDFSCDFVTSLLSVRYSGGGGGGRTRVRKCYWSRELHA